MSVRDQVFRILASVLVVSLVGLLVYTFLHYAYSHNLLAFDISDSEGHGPDSDTIEGQSAYAFQTARFSALVALGAGAFAFGTRVCRRMDVS
jgi:hypothetical protein